MTLGDLERRDAMGQVFSRISLITLVPLYVERPNSAGQHVRKAVWVSYALTTYRGRCPSAPKFLGYSSIYAYTL